MIFTISFGEPENVTNPGQDGVQYSFPFSVIDSALIGAPEQTARTMTHRIIVPISRSRLVSWSVQDDALIKILFEYGKRHVAYLVKSNDLPAEYTIRFPTITTVSHPDSVCPFDPAVIEEPTGASIAVERAKPQIGFSAS
ncbi:MAG TPA: hypothetical protein VIW07_07525 [Candidatus Udaeobacter sp.]|jgi:hypothetical protein